MKKTERIAQLDAIDSPTVRILAGDCIDLLRALPDASVHSIVTDPPYGLEFMGKEWDNYGTPRGFQDWCEEWAVECLRVLTPGGHMLAFGGTRLWHRLASAVEDAGFEVRDSMAWMYATGFPKSRNLDGDWAGWGTALKPAFEPIVVARKTLSGTVAATVLAHGTGALNIDGTRVGGTAGRWPSNCVLSHAEDCEEVSPGNSNSKPAEIVSGGIWTPSTGKPAGPTYADTPARWDCHPACPVAELDAQSGVSTSSDRPRNNAYEENAPTSRAGKIHSKEGSVTGGHADTGGASRFFYQAKAAKRERVGCFVCTFCGMPQAGFSHPMPPAPRCMTCGALTTTTKHPTVKPLALMRQLVRLVTPPGGTVLEPFAGSGTTVEAAILEGFSVIACEKTPEYLPLIRERVRRAQADQRPQSKPAPKPARAKAPVAPPADDALPFG